MMDRISKEMLEVMKQVDIRTVDKESLVDISGIEVDKSLSGRERIADFVRRAGNPYCFRCGRVAVKVGFADTDVTLEERLVHLIKDR